MEVMDSDSDDDRKLFGGMKRGECTKENDKIRTRLMERSRKLKMHVV